MSAEWDTRVAETNGDRATEYIKIIQAQAADLQTRLDRCEALLYDERVKSFALECVVEQQAKDNALLGDMCDRAIARNVERVVREGTPGPGYPFNVSPEQFRADAAEDAGLA